jgi:hypothetical protein
MFYIYIEILHVYIYLYKYGIFNVIYSLTLITSYITNDGFVKYCVIKIPLEGFKVLRSRCTVTRLSWLCRETEYDKLRNKRSNQKNNKELKCHKILEKYYILQWCVLLVWFGDENH